MSKNVWLIVFTIFISACSSEPIGKKKLYSTVYFAGFFNDTIQINLRGVSEYCTREEYGQTYYSNSCSDKLGNKYFAEPKDAFEEAEKQADKICKGKAYIVGQKHDEIFSGNSTIRCSSYRGYGTNNVSTNCRGGEALFDPVVNLFYKCSKTNLQKVSDKDRAFLDKMLNEKRITQERYNELIGNSVAKDFVQATDEIDLSEFKKNTEERDKEFNELFEQ